jgi:hypothetical protein
VSDTLARVKELAASANVVVSEHAYERLDENNITTLDIEAGIGGAVAVEDYPDAHRGPSVLALQRDTNRGDDPRRVGLAKGHDRARSDGDCLSTRPAALDF